VFLLKISSSTVDLIGRRKVYDRETWLKKQNKRLKNIILKRNQQFVDKLQDVSIEQFESHCNLYYPPCLTILVSHNFFPTSLEEVSE
jgi:hypothetical protein